MDINFTEDAMRFSNSTRDEINLWAMVPVGLVFLTMILATAVGNVFVVIVVIREKQLKTTTNKLVASLAVTDLIIGVLVMPMAAVYHIAGSWMFGWILCDIFVILDVLCCTSSILHLVAIAMDRYWSFTDISYNRGSRKHKYFLPIAVIGTWLMSAAICIPGFFGWREEQKIGMCLISQDKIYTIYSTVGAFYLPLVVIIVIYFKIFLVVRARVRGKSIHRPSISQAEPSLRSSNTCQTLTTSLSTSPSRDIVDSNADNNNSLPVPLIPCPDSNITMKTNGDSINDVGEEIKNGEYFSEPASHKSIHTLLKSMPLLGMLRQGSNNKQKDKLAAKRERRALRTLMIITGAFISCWLPFFIFAAMLPFCTSCNNIPLAAIHFVTWLGYFNSMLNPVIYTIFNTEFRKAFKKLLCIRKNC